MTLGVRQKWTRPLGVLLMLAGAAGILGSLFVAGIIETWTWGKAEGESYKDASSRIHKAAEEHGQHPNDPAYAQRVKEAQDRLQELVDQIKSTQRLAEVWRILLRVGGLVVLIVGFGLYRISDRDSS